MLQQASRFTDATKIVTAGVHAARRFAGTGRDSLMNAELKPEREPGDSGPAHRVGYHRIKGNWQNVREDVVSALQGNIRLD